MQATPKIRLFIDAPLKAGATLTLDRDQTHYLATVMRVRAGTLLALFNGRDGEWLAEVQEVSRKAATLQLLDQRRPQQAEPDLWLAFAPIKKARLDFMAQKATELGVSHLLPVMTEYTVAERVKLERLKANAREAAEQCGRLNVPQCREPGDLQSLLDAWPADRLLMFCDEDLSGMAAHDALVAADEKAAPRPWGILIGPEGGFSPSERLAIKALPNTVTVALGPRILRADTAAIAAISLWQSAIGDW